MVRIWQTGRRHGRGLTAKSLGASDLSNILIGTCGWTDPTLIKSGRFYPSEAKTAEERLQFYAQNFPLVEVDSSYYGLPAERVAGLWAERTPEDFVFDFKAFRLFTQHPTPPNTLPKDIRDTLGLSAKGGRNLSLRDLPEEVVGDLWHRWNQALLPLDSAGKLGVVLLQFPPWFFPTRESRDYILRCQQWLGQYRAAVEFRHHSWFNERNLERTIRFLQDNKLPLVCVDEPQGFASSMPPLALATADLSMVRFHGRNTQTWEKKGISAAERFDYLYSEKELGEWLPRIQTLSAQTSQLHLLFNNCYQDKAMRNAQDMARLLGPQGQPSSTTG